jgi:glycerophosphoryl diester phosphodiesterase
MLYYIIIIALVFVSAHCLSWRPNKTSKNPNASVVWFAHRGASIDEPENTMPAFKKAVHLKMPGIEIDTVSTKDGVVVCSHNFDLERNTNGFGYIYQMNYKDIKNLNVATKKENICTLEDVFNEIGNDTQINIEIKTHKLFDLKTAYHVVRLIREAQSTHRVIVSSFNALTLWAVKIFNKKIKTGFILKRKEFLPLVFVAHPDSIHPRGDIVTAPLLNFVKQKGLQMNVWTVNSKPAIDWLINQKVDGIITDRLEYCKA